MFQLDRIRAKKKELVLVSDINRGALRVELMSSYPLMNFLFNSGGMILSGYKLWESFRKEPNR